MRVAPSAHDAWIEKSSVWTLSAPAALKAAIPHCNRLLHGWSAGDAASDLVRQLLQVGFQGGRLLGLGDHAIGRVLGESSAKQD